MFESEHGSFRSKVELKRLAKKLLEERVEIRRMNDEVLNEENSVSIDSKDKDIKEKPKAEKDTMISNYTFEIVFDRFMNVNEQENS